MEISQALNLDIKLVIGTIYTPDQLVNLYESQRPLSGLKETMISILNKEPESNGLKLSNILLTKLIIREMFTGKKASVIAKEHDTSPSKILELLSSIGIYPRGSQKVIQLAKWRDIFISRKLLKEGYDVANVAIHLKIRLGTLKTYSGISLSRLPFNTEADLIQEFADLWLYINKKIEERYSAVVPNDEPDTYFDEFLKGKEQRSLRNSTSGHANLAAELIKKIESGKTLQDISSEFKMSYHKIRVILRLSNTDLKTIRIRASEQNRATRNNEQAQFRILIESGKTPKEIIAITGYSKQAIINLRRQTGILYTSIVQKYIKDSYIRGATVRQIAQDFLCSKTRIYEIVSFKPLKPQINRKEATKDYKKRGRKPFIHEVTKALLEGLPVETIVEKGIASRSTIYRCKKTLKL